eukprot:Gregarina_sp_Poly_1__5155@NODE_272_length_10257_cov_229_971246_g237_i0_p3_GENE_NODE_272_length_10257_cov_229_971246_g237_i0NODE_272_length_10257_cov_229_971246_g237_i0_p3_ORF_typecomplete_len418_score58_85FAS_I_H/PF18314_1/2_2e03FAS_I_H/PF18314_1/0_089FlpD/PF02662_16/0_14UvrDhelicase/PF00580_21/0_11HTH_8/PF02954_19/1_5HTH_8/PF02954_19/8_7e02_NODE_272_length_10257_cov_229_971246_g237_i077308983
MRIGVTWNKPYSEFPRLSFVAVTLRMAKPFLLMPQYFEKPDDLSKLKRWTKVIKIEEVKLCSAAHYQLRTLLPIVAAFLTALKETLLVRNQAASSFELYILNSLKEALSYNVKIELDGAPVSFSTELQNLCNRVRAEADSNGNLSEAAVKLGYSRLKSKLEDEKSPHKHSSKSAKAKLSKLIAQLRTKAGSAFKLRIPRKYKRRYLKFRARLDKKIEMVQTAKLLVTQIETILSGCETGDCHQRAIAQTFKRRLAKALAPLESRIPLAARLREKTMPSLIIDATGAVDNLVESLRQFRSCREPDRWQYQEFWIDEISDATLMKQLRIETCPANQTHAVTIAPPDPWKNKNDPWKELWSFLHQRKLTDQEFAHFNKILNIRVKTILKDWMNQLGQIEVIKILIKQTLEDCNDGNPSSK